MSDSSSEEYDYKPTHYCDLCMGTSCRPVYCRNKWKRCIHCDRTAHEDSFGWINGEDVCDNCETCYSRCKYCDKYEWTGQGSSGERWSDVLRKYVYVTAEIVCQSCKQVKQRMLDEDDDRW